MRGLAKWLPINDLKIAETDMLRRAFSMFLLAVVPELSLAQAEGTITLRVLPEWAASDAPEFLVQSEAMTYCALGDLSQREALLCRAIGQLRERNHMSFEGAIGCASSLATANDRIQRLEFLLEREVDRVFSCRNTLAEFRTEEDVRPLSDVRPQNPPATITGGDRTQEPLPLSCASLEVRQPLFPDLLSIDQSFFIRGVRNNCGQCIEVSANAYHNGVKFGFMRGVANGGPIGAFSLGFVVVPEGRVRNVGWVGPRYGTFSAEITAVRECRN